MASLGSLWKHLLGVERAVVEDWDIDEDRRCFIVHVRPRKGGKHHCCHCNAPCPKYDRGAGRRRWRGLDLGTMRVFLEAVPIRVECAEHGVVAAAVPWARPRSNFTRAFEDQVAWLAVRMSRTATAELMRAAWRTIERIIGRVGDEARRRVDLLAGLRRIGIDELSHRKGQKYITVVVDHATGRLVWAAPGRDRATVERFFDDLGEERARELEFVTADGAAWIGEVVRSRVPQAILGIDPFHVVKWATDALDVARRDVWNDLRQSGLPDAARHLKNARWSLWKNPENLTPNQRETLSDLQRVNAPLYRAYLLKETLRTVFQEPDPLRAEQRLDGWIYWARRSRLPSFHRLAATVRTHREAILATVVHGLSNALIEAKNTQLRLLTRIAHGFHHASSLIALGMLKLSGLCPPLPGRIDPLRR